MVRVKSGLIKFGSGVVEYIRIVLNLLFFLYSKGEDWGGYLRDGGFDRIVF